MKYDVAIIGAGISGLGIAYKLKDSKLKIALYDEEGLAKNTSANSLRIIHGGLRYFQTLNISRIIESINAQTQIVNLLPNSVRKLDCYLPLNSSGIKSKIPMFAVGKMYELTYRMLSKYRIKTGIVNASEITEKIISNLNFKEYFLWNDYLLLSHENLVNEIYKSLQVDFIQEKVENYQNLNAKIIIDCTNRLDNIHFYKALNLIVNLELVKDSAVSLPTKDRMLFLTPRNGNTAIGTFYYNLNENNPIDLAIEEFNSCSNIKITRKNIISIDEGLLPNKFQDKFGLYGNNKIVVKNNLIQVLNTKYTTFLTVGDKVKKIVERL